MFRIFYISLHKKSDDDNIIDNLIPIQGISLDYGHNGAYC